MKIGTRSLLFGVHQFVWHPITVWLAWRSLYGAFPSWRETVCIIVHDWGYWGADDMDGPTGKMHPVRGAWIADRLFGEEYRDLVFLHSRSLAARVGANPSKLCWPDKFSMCFDPPAFYLFRARLSGELKEYRRHAHTAGFIPAFAPDHAWHRKLVAHLAEKAKVYAYEFRD